MWRALGGVVSRMRLLYLDLAVESVIRNRSSILD